MPHLVLMAALILYGTFLETLLGSTFGKLALGLRVADPDGAPPGFVRAFTRNLLKVIDFFPLPTGAVGLGFMVLTDSRSRLGDLAARTSVVVASLPPQDQPVA